jgi:hypothetical protein
MNFSTECGVPQTAWTPVGMPKIPDRVINSVFYLFASREEALSGKNPGGSGFIVVHFYVTKDDEDFFGTRHEFVYAVTNWHVAVDSGFSVIRLNKKDGGIDIIDLDPSEWTFLPGKCDVAVAELTIDENVHDVSGVSTDIFIDGRMNDFGIGDDVFMLGLFVDHEGISKNTPSARFGNVSMLPSDGAAIRQPTGHDGISYVVDMHSRTGFSGSPVFAYKTFGSDLEAWYGFNFDSIEMDLHDLRIRPSSLGRIDDPFRGATFEGELRASRGRIKSHNVMRLLGILWGQFPERWELKNLTDLAQSRRSGLITDGAYVRGMSGMSCVIPAWQILEVLDMPELEERRATKSRTKGIIPSDDLSVPDAQAISEADQNPSHKEDFTSLLNAAAKTKPQGGQT